MAEPVTDANTGLGPPALDHNDGLVRICQGDSTSLTFLQDASVNLIVTSPPYNLDMAYGDYRDDKPYTAYLKWVERWAEELYRVADVGGRACINIPLDTNKGGKQAIYADYIASFRNAGWSYHTTIVWNEQNISRRTAWGSWMSPTAPFVTAPVEMIPVFYKEKWPRKKEHRTPTISRDEFLEWTLGIWTFAGERPSRFGHPAPFPEELPRRLIRLYSFREDLVLDPFVGSGTTCAVAKANGRHSIGVDIDPGYCKLAIERCMGVYPHGPTQWFESSDRLWLTGAGPNQMSLPWNVALPVNPVADVTVKPAD